MINYETAATSDVVDANGVSDIFGNVSPMLTLEALRVMYEMNA